MNLERVVIANANEKLAADQLVVEVERHLRAQTHVVTNAAALVLERALQLREHDLGTETNAHIGLAAVMTRRTRSCVLLLVRIEGRALLRGSNRICNG